MRHLRRAIQVLMLIADLSGPTMFARIGIMPAINRHVERVLDPNRKDPHWDGASSSEIYETPLRAISLLPAPLRCRAFLRNSYASSRAVGFSGSRAARPCSNNFC
jgi:hypothetical protein